ncbi:Fur family transcriptional regulator [Luteimonas huabeiensis]|uniref:Fur family transcriptional regulator n=1 Tax=Luteimonas huabeiensis TaxID=1244513 RepID=UPI000464B79B|nr:Fur family transcriptional regulator [Luteimonas huabeiensis]
MLIDAGRSGAVAEPPEGEGAPAPGAQRDADAAASCAGRLRASGLRVTSSRLHVLQILAASGGRWTSPDEIYRALLARGVATTVASVYSALRTMEARGLVLREFHSGVNGAKAVYLAAPGTSGDGLEPAVFIVCRQCNADRQVRDRLLRRQLESAARRQGLAAAGQRLTLYITCERCAEGGARG